MTQPKAWADLARSLDASLTELVAGARALDWDFSSWRCASGYDASDPDVHLFFECLLAYARCEGRTGLN
jgi:hypothetical protein